MSDDNNMNPAAPDPMKTPGAPGEGDMGNPAAMPEKPEGEGETPAA